MDMAYTKLHQSLVTSTIWREPHPTRIVWITMMALADQHGEVMASVPGLADASRVSIRECEAALASFLAPDPYSRTKDFEGRRIEEIDGGWSLLNHPKYRRMASKDESKEKASARTARYRARLKQKASLSTVCDGVSTHGRDIAEAEAEAEAENKNTPLPPKGGGKARRRKKSEGQSRVKENTPQMIRIGALFGRQPETLWTIAEAESLAIANPTDKEISGMEFYYNATIPEEKDHRRTALQTLLNNWNIDLDRARQLYKATHP
jgi:hypothetical protein